jgi:tRNA(fMet)-specific endonuclease VapC
VAEKTVVVDTSLWIDFFRKVDKSKTRLVELSLQYSQIAIAAVTEFEIYSGATLQQLPFWTEVLTEVVVLPFDSKAAHIAVDVQRELKRQRKSIEKADLFIAATAIANNLPLDTLNRKHFDKIGQLTLL